MSTTFQADHNQVQLERIMELLEKGSMYEIRNLIHSLYPAETARIIESLEIEERGKIWSVIPPSVMGEILVKLNEEVAAGLIRITDRKDLIRATESLEEDARIDLLQVLPEPILSQVLESIGVIERKRLESALAYDEHSAGGMMSLDIITVRADISLDEVLGYLRKRGEMPAATDGLMVVDEEQHFQGWLPLATLLTKKSSLKVREVMNTEIQGISYQMPASEVALLFEQREILSAPVLSGSGVVLGKITLEDVIKVIRTESGHSLMSMAGLDEEQDMFAPVVVSSKRRAIWLGINLFTAFLASWVIGLFEATLDQIVALAVLMPIVASMGGIAGSQTLTLVIRGLALRQVNNANAGKLLLKELSVGVLNGALWAVVVAIIAGVWFKSSSIGLLLGCAMLINLICAALAGATIPLVLRRMGIDPALAGGVLLTTVTDVVGFTAFLGLATLFLL
jgi:magnesium transporter